MATSEVQHFMQLKAALTVTTNTQGWTFIRQIADRVVQKASTAAIDETDSHKGEVLRLKAQALKEGFRDVFNAIETAKNFGTDEEPDWFSQLQFEEQPTFEGN